MQSLQTIFRTRSYLAHLVGIALITLVASSSAVAKEVPLTTDSILYAQGTGLWQISATGENPREILTLPWDAEKLSNLVVAQDGTALLLQANGFTAWTPLSETSAPLLQYLPCSGVAALSGDGKQVACQTLDHKKIAIYQLRPTLSVRIISRSADGPLLFSGTDLVCHGPNTNLVTCDDESKELSSHRPSSALQVAQGGNRAVGAYTEGQIDVVYTFKLDGTATKRTLVPAARPISISSGMQWVAIQQEIDACAARIMGGQYMCWPRYQALDISSQGKNLLLLLANKTSGHDLYMASVSGTKSLAPKQLAKGIGPKAVFIPSHQE